jgi:hypothetical protein
MLLSDGDYALNSVVWTVLEAKFVPGKLDKPSAKWSNPTKTHFIGGFSSER